MSDEFFIEQCDESDAPNAAPSRAELEGRAQPTRLSRQEMADFASNHAMLAEALSGFPAHDPPLPTEEPWRSLAISARSAFKNHGINVCSLGVDAEARIRPPRDNGAA